MVHHPFLQGKFLNNFSHDRQQLSKNFIIAESVDHDISLKLVIKVKNRQQELEVN